MDYHMKSFILILTILTILNISVTHASEDIFFSPIPSNVTSNGAMTSVMQAAIKRQWTPHQLENNKLKIELDHRGYKAILIFSFSDKGIYYSDHTTYFSDALIDEDEEGIWEAASAPGNWIGNLKIDTNNYFAVNAGRATSETFSHDNVEMKLQSLKALYDKKLITESEYNSKRKKVMSSY